MSGSTTKWRCFQGHSDIYLYYTQICYMQSNIIIYKSLKNTSKNKSPGFFIFGHSWFFNKCPKTKKVSKCFSWHWKKFQEIKNRRWNHYCIGKIKYKNAFFSKKIEKPKKIEKNIYFWNRKHPIISVPKTHIGIIKCSINIRHSDIYFIYKKKLLSVLSVPKNQKMLQYGGSFWKLFVPT
jgi:hypothetical protein